MFTVANAITNGKLYSERMQQTAELHANASSADKGSLQTSTKTSTVELIKGSKEPYQSNEFLKKIISASTGGAIGAFICYPFEELKKRITSD